uniref:Extracellular matrix protein 2 n=1 Tax=Eptatretus burgeri TaxID=7764 RepID=A0A8C4QSA2_EPTBU
MQSRPSLILHHYHIILSMLLINFLAALLLPIAAQEPARKREDTSRLQAAHRETVGHRRSLEGDDKRETVTLDSYLEEDAGYDVLPGHTGQCRMHGMIMFNGAVWSPRSCVTCICRHGRIACDTIKCEHSRCQSGLAQDTHCCATCGNTENDITTVPPHIFDGLPNLEWMDLSRNLITTRHVAPAVFQNLTFLRRLYLDDNQLTQIPHPLPASLEEIRINNNRLEVLDADSFQGLSHLVALELKNNRLSESTITPGAFSPLMALTFLRLELNYFRLIPFDLPQSLEELFLDGNQIEEIKDGAISPASMLGTLQLRNNSLKDEAISQNALLALKNLESLDLSHNPLKHVPSYLPVVLRHLVLTHNQIERIPGFVFAHMKPGLQYLYLSFNQIGNSGVDPSSLFGTGHSLHELFLDYNKLQSVPLGLTSLKSIKVIAMNDNRISTIPDNAFCNDMDPEDSSLISLHLENNYIERREIPHTAFSCIKSLSSVILRPQKPIPKPDEHDQC